MEGDEKNKHNIWQRFFIIQGCYNTNLNYQVLIIDSPVAQNLHNVLAVASYHNYPTQHSYTQRWEYKEHSEYNYVGVLLG